MKFYMAPLEGITGHVYRRALHEVFGEGIEKFYTPFVEPHEKKENLNTREREDVLPENNRGIPLVPQVLTNSAELFLAMEKRLLEYGYRELNINLGCPSGTVVTKGRGAGFLQYPEKLEAFLDGVYTHTNCEVSLKIRLGMQDPAEFEKLLSIYEKFPVKELIIHPRVQKEMYKGLPHLDRYRYAAERSRLPLVYNGDICGPDGYDSTIRYITAAEQGTDTKTTIAPPQAVMIGRGMIADPALIRKLSRKTAEDHHETADSSTGAAAKAEIERFLQLLLHGYMNIMSGDQPTLHKMKEVWSYLILSYPGKEKAYRRLLKSRKITEYEDAVREILA